jgi:hypothetical protein
MQYRPHRYPTAFPVEIRTPSGPQQGTVVDVNMTGARITGVRGLWRGDRVHFTVLSRQAEGVVAWARQDMIGIIFRPVITDELVDTLRYRRDGRTQAGPGRVGYRFAEMR